MAVGQEVIVGIENSKEVAKFYTHCEIRRIRRISATDDTADRPQDFVSKSSPRGLVPSRLGSSLFSVRDPRPNQGLAERRRRLARLAKGLESSAAVQYCLSSWVMRGSSDYHADRNAEALGDPFSSCRCIQLRRDFVADWSSPMPWLRASRASTFISSPDRLMPRRQAGFR